MPGTVLNTQYEISYLIFSTILSILQMRTLKLREVIQLLSGSKEVS
jgi:hypothetical protein